MNSAECNNNLLLIREYLENGCVPINCQTNPTSRISKTIEFKKGEKRNFTGVHLEERCVLIIDIVGFTKKDMIGQLFLVKTMNILIRNSIKNIKKLVRDWKDWEIYKGTGDGAIFIFGNLRNPSYLRDVLLFAVWTMKTIIEYNNKLPVDALNHIKVRMALSYGEIFVAEDLQKQKDVLGDAINKTSRLVSLKEAKANSIFITSEIYHVLQINKELFFLNHSDGSIPVAGELSDFIVGKKPDARNFLYIVRKGEFKTKDMILEVFNIAGRLDNIDIKVYD